DPKKDPAAADPKKDPAAADPKKDPAAADPKAAAPKMPATAEDLQKLFPGMSKETAEKLLPELQKLTKIPESLTDFSSGKGGPVSPGEAKGGPVSPGEAKGGPVSPGEAKGGPAPGDAAPGSGKGGPGPGGELIDTLDPSLRPGGGNDTALAMNDTGGGDAVDTGGGGDAVA
ncbi:MAG TPA: hypothetical protein VFA20_33460, partial [Myxococcaceae bacterium]|nr:hypothetical protein [Myxococcaceae bacterium]